MQQKRSIPIELPISVAEIRAKARFDFEVEASVEQLKALAALLDAPKVSKFRFEGCFETAKKDAISLKAVLGATVQQECSVTLKPMNTRVDTKLERLFVERPKHANDTDEIEFHEDDPEDFVPSEFLLFDLAAEALALELPEYPKLPDAELKDAIFTEPGKAPMTDQDARPFAGLAALKDSLKDQEDGS